MDQLPFLPLVSYHDHNLIIDLPRTQYIKKGVQWFVLESTSQSPDQLTSRSTVQKKQGAMYSRCSHATHGDGDFCPFPKNPVIPSDRKSGQVISFPLIICPICLTWPHLNRKFTINRLQLLPLNLSGAVCLVYPILSLTSAIILEMGLPGEGNGLSGQ